MSTHYIDNFADKLGPEKIIHIYDPKTQLRAIVAIDNLALGPAIGGCRMAPDVSTLEVFRLARAMTLKNAVNGLKHGGAKSGILADSKSPDKEKLIRIFARAIRELEGYIPGPDMGTDEQSMAWVKEETGRAVGLPRLLGGLPLDELGMTGYGVAVAADVAGKTLGLPLKGARVSIQGFGNVGKAAARFLMERGAKVVAVNDSKGTLADTAGIDIPSLIEFVQTGGKVADSRLGQALGRDELLTLESDIFIPAARPDVFTELNQHLLKTRLVLEGANIPITTEAAKKIHDRGIWIVPDIIANSGGVICAATEYQGLTADDAYATIRETIGRNTAEVLRRVRDGKRYPHEAALNMAREPIDAAMQKNACA
ncbi:MAG: Glu/Leu/Phe/Val dehydrogenase [Nitrospinaceae bacterium]|nr:Glu/Leu/Phe/Val dehydrogenase [Nitrospinaceae bacterium]NIR55361.1 Glu/Leu/Phe/Val dehydrogenase [Nitrospinaceae bacterium]NIS85801.1 Glu/Leu/Phe/Val dehydrogenase [Nitrospinaceae bacterium]NIT82653.1 Glu/Leu/Phe/Val dehydrogenase [Nitrospinaceae bacterium]NIU44855.1 Glu/Leu/Phe/Val dehydrogenase [Nitrospinaceae bacterium]